MINSVDWSKPLKTKAGRPYRLIGFKSNGRAVGEIDEQAGCIEHWPDGRYNHDYESRLDLVNPPTPKVRRWVVVSKKYQTCSSWQFAREEDAKHFYDENHEVWAAPQMIEIEQ